MNLFFIILIAISLSMDAFSLSLAYGTLDIKKTDRINLSFIVGAFHFFMPLFGSLIGNKLLRYIFFDQNIIVFIILTLIGLEMIIDTLKNDNKVEKMKIFQMVIFAFSVSLDSFSVGIGLSSITNSLILSSVIFSLSSFSFTFFGLYIGNKINHLLGKVSTLFGGIILMIIALFYLI